MSKLFYEKVTERSGELVLASTVSPATSKQIERARKLHAKGKCDHAIIKDMDGWPYDIRYCAICKKYLGSFYF